jgi:acetyl/propionyl-CoA carboxylase alpha subunit
MRYFVKIGDQTVELAVEHCADGSYRVRAADGKELSVCALARGRSLHTLSVAGRVLEVQLSDGEVKLAGQRFIVRAESERERAATRTDAGDTLGAREILAPMPGQIVRVLCAPGQSVLKGASLVVIEAMKMQNELCAKSDHVIRSVRVASGDTVDRGAVLIEFE